MKAAKSGLDLGLLNPATSKTANKDRMVQLCRNYQFWTNMLDSLKRGVDVSRLPTVRNIDNFRERGSRTIIPRRFI